MTNQAQRARFVPVSDGPQRVCCYLRVSTGRQAEGDLSIPDQRKQVHAFCMAKGWPVVGEYVEPGASATDDNRPEFQRMIERAGDDDTPSKSSSCTLTRASSATASAWKCTCADWPGSACG